MRSLLYPLRAFVLLFIQASSALADADRAAIEAAFKWYDHGALKEHLDKQVKFPATGKVITDTFKQNAFSKEQQAYLELTLRSHVVYENAAEVISWVENLLTVEARVQSILNTPIAFYGKVVDQNGHPVSDADVAFVAVDKFAQSGSQYSTRSNKDGFFNITGIRGGGLMASVRKQGYYHIHNASNQSFDYGMGQDSHKAPPTQAKPAIFVLRKMGRTEPLIKIAQSYRVPRDGTPVEVDLTNGRVSSPGHLRVEAWTQDQSRDAQGHYSWRCRVSVPGGSLVPRTGEFNFEAPLDGYMPFDEIVMPQEAKRWNSKATREYFIKLADGRFARLQLRMIAGGDHFFSIESYLNPSAGSRNLEWDPKSQVAGHP
jgi:hypothetical protein